MVQKENVLLHKCGISRGLNRMAGVGVSADGVENGYEEAVVAEARAWIVLTQARVIIQIAS
jgi:hypothetical protein